MHIWSLFHHRLRAYWRVPFRGRRFASLLIGAFIALYFGAGLVLAGLFFDDVVREVAPDADPLLVAARGLLPFGLVYAAVRVVMGSGLGVDPRPYQSLPVRRSALVGLLAVFALFSLWNAVPLAFIGAVCVEMAASGAGGPALRFGLVGIGVLAAGTYAAPMLRRAVSGRPVVAVGLVGLLVVATALGAVDVGTRLVSLLDVSGWLFGGVVWGVALPVATALGLLVGIVSGYVKWLRGAMVVDRSRRQPSSPGSRTWMDRLARRGPAWREAVLEARRYLRNKQLRLTIFLTPLIAGSFGFVGYITPRLDDLHFNLFVFGFFGTGFHILQGAPNLFSYEGRQVEAVQSRPVPIRDRMRGRWLTLAVGALILYVLPLPVIIWTWSPFTLFHTAFFLYNVGMFIPLILTASVFNRKSVNANQHSMGDSPGLTTERAVLMIPAIGLPGAFYPLMNDAVLHLAIIGGLGIVSLSALPLWLCGLATLYERNRYAMMRGFRASRS